MMFEVLGSALFLFEDNASADDGKHAGRRGKGVCRCFGAFVARFQALFVFAGVDL
jgi:hypothetical protein